MKQVKIKKLSLNKSTISKLNEENLTVIKGGGTTLVVTNYGTCVNCGASHIAACYSKVCSGACH
jgi:natural product precursor